MAEVFIKIRVDSKEAQAALEKIKGKMGELPSSPVIRPKFDSAPAVANLRNFVQEFNSAVAQAQQTALAFAIAAQRVGGLAQAINTPIKDSLAQYRDYASAIKVIQVRSGASRAEIQPLTDEIRRLGIETSKAPTEVANLAGELITAGATIKEAQESLAGIVQASEASGEGLALVGEIVGATRNQFGLLAEDTQRVADVLVAGANNSANTISTLGEALKYVGAVAASNNQSLEDTVFALGLLANQGIKGSMAGTNLAQAIQRLSLASAGLSNETGVTTKGLVTTGQALEELGVQVRGADGKMRSLRELLPEIQAGFQRLDPGDRAVIAKVLFGDEGGRAMLSLLNSSAQKTEQLGRAIDNAAGTAAAASAKQIEGFGGSLVLLESSVATLQQQFAEQLAPAIAAGAQALTALVNTVIAAPGPVKFLLASLAATTGTLLALTAAGLGLFSVLGVASAGFKTVTGAIAAKTAATAANTAVTIANTGAITANTAAKSAQATAIAGATAATNAGTAAMVKFAAATAAAAAPVAVLGAALGVLAVAVQTRRLRDGNLALEEYESQLKATADQAVVTANQIKFLQEKAATGTASKEDLARLDSLKKAAENQISTLKEQISLVQQFKPANEEQANSQKALIAGQERLIQVLQKAIDGTLGLTAAQSDLATTAEAAAKATEQAYTEALENLASAEQKANAEIAQAQAAGVITAEEAEAQRLETKRARLEEELQLAKEAGKDTAKIEQQIAETEIEAQEHAKEKTIEGIELRKKATEAYYDSAIKGQEALAQEIEQQTEQIQNQIGSLTEQLEGVNLDRDFEIKKIEDDKSLSEEQKKAKIQAVTQEALKKEFALREQIFSLEQKAAELAAKKVQIEAKRAVLAATKAQKTAELELQQAQASGDQKAIADAQNNLALAKEELALARDQLEFANENIKAQKKLAAQRAENFQKEKRNAFQDVGLTDEAQQIDDKLNQGGTESKRIAEEIAKVQGAIAAAKNEVQALGAGLAAASLSIDGLNKGMSNFNSGISQANSGLRQMGGLIQSNNLLTQKAASGSLPGGGSLNNLLGRAGAGLNNLMPKGDNGGGSLPGGASFGNMLKKGESRSMGGTTIDTVNINFGQAEKATITGAKSAIRGRF